MVPLLSLFWLVPVHSPAQISRVDVGGKTVGEFSCCSSICSSILPVLKAMKLVRSDEVHLASESSLITLIAKVVSISRNIRA